MAASRPFDEYAQIFAVVPLLSSYFAVPLSLYLTGVHPSRLESLPPRSSGELVHEYVDEGGEIVSMSSKPSGVVTHTAPVIPAAPVPPQLPAAPAEEEGVPCVLALGV